jgi:hypothetical protein
MEEIDRSILTSTAASGSPHQDAIAMPVEPASDAALAVEEASRMAQRALCSLRGSTSGFRPITTWAR